jgi:predicted enzyme related to lactoylglutathione lyase
VDHARVARAAGRRRAADETERASRGEVVSEEDFADGIPATMFGVDDIQAEYQRLVEAGVTFTMAPTTMGNVTVAVFDDTCGNLIQMIQNH